MGRIKLLLSPLGTHVRPCQRAICFLSPWMPVLSNPHRDHQVGVLLCLVPLPERDAPEVLACLSTCQRFISFARESCASCRRSTLGLSETCRRSHLLTTVNSAA